MEKLNFGTANDCSWAVILKKRDSLKQARGTRLEVIALTKEHCGVSQWVTPLVVFVDDWKIKNKWCDTDARVFSTDRVADCFDRQQPELMRREIPPSLKLRRGRRSGLLAPRALGEKLTKKYERRMANDPPSPRLRRGRRMMKASGRGKAWLYPGSADFSRGIARQPRERCLVSSGILAGGGSAYVAQSPDYGVTRPIGQAATNYSRQGDRRSRRGKNARR